MVVVHTEYVPVPATGTMEALGCCGQHIERLLA